jgi:release factor glutamine methyltransferase
LTSVSRLVETSRLPPGEARVLLAHALHADRAWVIAHGNDAVEQRQEQEIVGLFARRRAGEPVAYLTGEREFYGLSLEVNASVLIPRPETELVVDQALAMLRDRTAPRIVDLGTGSGAIAVAIAHERPDAEVWASDESTAALAVASRNVSRHAVAVRLVHGDWFAALGGERFDVIASNPPYVPEGDPHLGAGDLRFEPKAALIGGSDGLDCIRTIASAARTHLVPGGWLIFEHGYDQASACVQMLAQLGYTGISDETDLAGLPRVCRGQFDAASGPR